MKEELRIHSFIHFKGTIRMCLEDGCDQIFKTGRLLRIHMQKHEVKKSFQCPTCGEYFTFNTGLAKHIRLNRCKGPVETSDKSRDDLNLEIAMRQLEEITNSKKQGDEVKKEAKIESDHKYENTPHENDSDVDFEENLPQVELKQPPLIKSRAGRSHLVYTCDYCGKSIKYKKNIEEHMKIHKSRGHYQCKVCMIEFKSRKALVDHSLSEHQVKLQVVKGEHICNICGRQFDNRSSYLAHKLCHDESARNHVCNVCSAAFKTLGNLRRHEATHTETRNYHCHDCQKSFKTKLALKVHRESVHAPLKIFVNCPVCEAIVQEKTLKSHMKTKHTAEGQQKPFMCTVCNATFRTEKIGERHYEHVHERKRLGTTYRCPECPELEFYRQSELKEHSFEHFNGIIYQCDCQKMFKTKRLLIAHQRVHLEVPVSFDCKHCKISPFKTRGGLRKHEKKNHSIEMLECTKS